MMEKKIDLDDYVDELPLSVASYRGKIKIMLKEFAKEFLELAADQATLLKEDKDIGNEFIMEKWNRNRQIHAMSKPFIRKQK